MYQHEIEEHLKNGGKAMRLSSPNATFRKISGEVGFDKKTSEEHELSGKHTVEAYVREENGEKIFGYQLTHEDRTHQDWQPVK